MSNLVGTYSHKRNENLDPYFQALGVPFVARKMMALSSPSLVITNEDDVWTITTSTTLRTVTCKFQLGEEYDEQMPGGQLKCTTTKEDEDTLKTVSVGPNDTKIVRVYKRTEEGCTLTLRHEESGVEGKRYFKKNS